jgi:hypothetical protein
VLHMPEAEQIPAATFTLLPVFVRKQQALQAWSAAAAGLAACAGLGVCKSNERHKTVYVSGPHVCEASGIPHLEYTAAPSAGVEG